MQPQETKSAQEEVASVRSKLQAALEVLDNREYHMAAAFLSQAIDALDDHQSNESGVCEGQHT